MTKKEAIRISALISRILLFGIFRRKTFSSGGIWRVVKVADVSKFSFLEVWSVVWTAVCVDFIVGVAWLVKIEVWREFCNFMLSVEFWSDSVGLLVISLCCPSSLMLVSHLVFENSNSWSSISFLDKLLFLRTSMTSEASSAPLLWHSVLGRKNRRWYSELMLIME